MDTKLFSDENTRDHRLFLCPTCNSEFFADVSDEEIICEECGEMISFDEEEPEEFVWHPSEEY